ncbi:MAG: hypothetical protein VKL97_02125 [Cyanobacteriota bacterium]|nr:hypothetical protein [Cyanobacteriota bacterium]
MAEFSGVHAFNSGSMQQNESQDNTWDAMESYFECITTCSLDDGECVTQCVEQLRERG